MKSKTKKILNQEFSVVVNISLSYRIEAKTAQEAIKKVGGFPYTSPERIGDGSGQYIDGSFKVIEAIDKENKSFQ